MDAGGSKVAAPAPMYEQVCCIRVDANLITHGRECPKLDICEIVKKVEFHSEVLGIHETYIPSLDPQRRRRVPRVAHTEGPRGPAVVGQTVFVPIRWQL